MTVTAADEMAITIVLGHLYEAGRQTRRAARIMSREDAIEVPESTRGVLARDLRTIRRQLDTIERAVGGTS